MQVMHDIYNESFFCNRFSFLLSEIFFFKINAEMQKYFL